MNLEERKLEILRKYQDIISVFVVELEVRDCEYPIEIFNEIRAIFTHLARFELCKSEDDLQAAESHVKRAVLDCYKYLCISIAEKVKGFHQQYKNVDLSIIDNGDFLRQLNELDNKCRNAYISAKKADGKKMPEDTTYCMYESAYNQYSKLDNLIDDAYEKVQTAQHKSSIGKRINICSIIVTTISIAITVWALLR